MTRAITWGLCLLTVLAESVRGQATLPTSHSGGWQTTTLPAGWSKSGLGTDYASNYDATGGNAGKLDNTGDNIVIQYDSVATQLTYWVAGNGFVGGTFTVEESSNGSAWTAMSTYTSLTGAARFTNVPASVSRYVRLYYTTKVTGNVGFDGVQLLGGGGGGGTPPVLAAIGHKSTRTNILVQFAASATPTDGDGVTLGVSNAPAGSTFGATNNIGTFTWAGPSPSGVYTMSFYAVDIHGADSETITITVTNTPAATQAGSLWINEIHYDNQGGDTNEGIEIAGSAGYDLSGVSVWYYDAGTFLAYSNVTLGGTIDNESNGVGSVWVDAGYSAAGQIQNGPDGVALVINATQVVQFLSWEGVMTASGGPAQGLTSDNIGVSETGSTPLDWSLQLCGTGTNYAGFAWSTNLPHSRGTLNACQVIPGSGGGGNDDDADGLPNDWEIQFFGGATNAQPGVDSDGDGQLNGQEFIALTVPTSSNSYFRVDSVSNAAARAILFQSVTGRLYGLWSTTNLPGGSWTLVASDVAGTGSPLSMNDTNGASATMYRIDARLAP